MIICILLAVYFLCFYLIAGMMFAHVYSIYEDEIHYRETLGNACAMAILEAFFGPIGVLTMFCMTGFAEHGCHFRKEKRK